MEFWLCLQDLCIYFARKIFFSDSIIFSKKNLRIYLFQISLLQSPPSPPAQPAPPAPPASPAPTEEAQAYIPIFIPDYGCFRLKQQHLGQKLRVFFCSELLWALESNETLFPLWQNSKPKLEQNSKLKLRKLKKTQIVVPQK